MKITAHSIIMLTALMWMGSPFALGFGLSWGIVYDWFFTFDFGDPITYRLILARIGFVLTAIHVVHCSVRVLSGRIESVGWHKIRIMFNILFSLFWVFCGVVLIQTCQNIFTFGPAGDRVQDFHMLWIPCLTPLMTGIFYVVRTAMVISRR